MLLVERKMAGLYIHIPFCKQACVYCNFHFSTNLKKKDAMMEAIQGEIALHGQTQKWSTLTSIYLGGGTPSLLNQDDIKGLFRVIESHFEIATDLETTLEANPDDLTTVKLAQLADSPINRLSIGIQSFHQEDLQFMHRAHTAAQGHAAISQAKTYGFEHISVDLMYGVPTMGVDAWDANLNYAFEYGIPHLSCYALTIEPRTALSYQIRKGLSPAPTDEETEQHFLHLIELTDKRGYEHYEISNFAKPGHHASHNTSYWQGIPYLGIGPSAHSFDGVSRSWNVSNNAHYVKALSEGVVPATTEILRDHDRYNEYVMTGLRTCWGCDLHRIKAIDDTYADFFLTGIQDHLAKGMAVENEGIFTLSTKGKLFADQIASDLFWV